MRQIGHINSEASALTFSDALYVNGIENTIKEEDGGWAIWVIAEEKIPEAKALLKEYLEDPDSERFHQVGEKAHEIKKVAHREEEAYKKRMEAARKKVSGVFENRTGRLTLALIVISAAVALLSQLGNNKSMLGGLFITDYDIIGNRIQWRPGLQEVRNGQIWRLVTPIFIHFGIIHILFNMLWLRSLGTAIERRLGPFQLAALVIGIAIISNVGQYMLTGPSFGGMSGVVFGLLGYIWIRGRYDPNSGLYVDRLTVQMMIFWFILGLTGLIGNIANGTHGFGLATGMAWGYIAARNR